MSPDTDLVLRDTLRAIRDAANAWRALAENLTGHTRMSGLDETTGGALRAALNRIGRTP